ncbi:thioredoxin family protein [Chryseobacterium oranimense]|uniref:thioredoxin family protein n=1 Tax=Chryseobacterium oranimense TaxID=421058 RepID=UPI002236B05E|nr:thioredoxin family protein [Chryseobacterium oranimense]
MKTGTFSDLETLMEKDPKPVIIHLYTDWCSVCKMEKKVLNNDREITDLIDANFYLVNFEAEKTKETIKFQGKEFGYIPNGNSGIHELALALSKNKDHPVYPLWIVLDKDQKLVYYHEGVWIPENMKQKLLEISAL